MKIIIFILTLSTILFAQNYNKEEFIKQSYKNGWIDGKCTYGSSKISLNGDSYSYELATSRAREKLVRYMCLITKEEERNNIVEKTSGIISSKTILRGKIKDIFVVAVCLNKPIICD